MSGPACDFCNVPDAVWRYPTYGFGQLLLGLASQGPVVNDLSGGWWACERCAEYVDADRYPELVDIAATKFAAEMFSRIDVPASTSTRATRRKYATKLHRETLTEMYAAFHRNRSGPPTRYVRRQAAS